MAATSRCYDEVWESADSGVNLERWTGALDGHPAATALVVLLGPLPLPLRRATATATTASAARATTAAGQRPTAD